MSQKQVNEAWAFFKPLVTKRDGSINLTQLKKELADFKHLLDNVPDVYYHVTGGSFSKVNYDAIVVISEAERDRERSAKQFLEDFVSDLENSGTVTGKKVLEQIKAYAKEY